MIVTSFLSFEVFIFAFCSFVTIIAFVSWDRYSKRRFFKFQNGLRANGLKYFPIIGNGLELIGLDIMGLRNKIKHTCGFPNAGWIWSDFIYVTTDPAEIKVILNHQGAFEKHSVYNNLYPLFGNSIVLAKFDRWSKNRKLLAKCFSQPMLMSFTNIFYEKSCLALEAVKGIECCNLLRIFERLSLESAYEGLLDLEPDKDSHIPQDLGRAQKFLESRLVTSYLYPDFIANLTPAGRQASQALKRYRALVREVVQKKKEALKHIKDIADDQKKSLFNRILEAEGTLYDEDGIFHEISLFIVAATETTGGGLAFTFTLLGMNPEVQEKIYLEVQEIAGIEGPISYDMLARLTYTDMAIRESLRLFPVIPVLGRQTTADIDLDNRTIPAGTEIFVNVLDLHRSETYWKDPLKYNPDRFLPDEIEERHPYSYIPFSAGPRNCIGMKYSMVMMKMFVANVIRHYHVTSNYKSVDDLDLTSAFTMKATHDLDCKFTPRVQ